MDFEAIKVEMRNRFEQQLITVHEEKELLRRRDEHCLKFLGKDVEIWYIVTIAWLDANKHKLLSLYEEKLHQWTTELEARLLVEASTSSLKTPFASKC